MFCPSCGAEYREGFTDCTDCQSQLVPQLPAEWSNGKSWSPFPPKTFLIWFIPVSVLFPFILLWMFSRFGGENLELVLSFVNFVYMISGFGSCWMIYQAVRYEERTIPWILLAFVPFMFLWYRLIRYPIRSKTVGIDGSATGTLA
jgi:hypothetical protein